MALKDFALVTNQLTIRTIWEYYGLRQYIQTEQTLPVVLGSLTNWTAVKLVPLVFQTALLLAKHTRKPALDEHVEHLNRIRRHVVNTLNKDCKGPLEMDFTRGMPGWSSFLYD